ncbi:MAG: DUF4834 family protein [Muribaculaceae bacterium]|nr:DUF4834 family protein [Muribaculaceae bacterium]
MIEFFLTIAIVYLTVYLVWPIVKTWMARYARRKMEERLHNMFREQFGMNFDTPRQQPPHESRRRSTRRTGKIFTRDVGEYVEFEETEIPLPPPPETRHTPMEPQVSDADWEEIQ